LKYTTKIGKHIFRPIFYINQNGQVEMTAPSKSNVSSIKLEFGVAPGERFSVQLLLGDVEVIENFVM
jgi:hypothetical protein